MKKTLKIVIFILLLSAFFLSGFFLGSKRSNSNEVSVDYLLAKIPLYCSVEDFLKLIQENSDGVTPLTEAFCLQGERLALETELLLDTLKQLKGSTPEEQKAILDDYEQWRLYFYKAADEYLPDNGFSGGSRSYYHASYVYYLVKMRFRYENSDPSCKEIFREMRNWTFIHDGVQITLNNGDYNYHTDPENDGPPDVRHTLLPDSCKRRVVGKDVYDSGEIRFSPPNKETISLLVTWKNGKFMTCEEISDGIVPY